jgi:hypothetical protein
LPQSEESFFWLLSTTSRGGRKPYTPPNETVDDYIERYAANAASSENYIGSTVAGEKEIGITTAEERAVGDEKVEEETPAEMEAVDAWGKRHE